MNTEVHFCFVNCDKELFSIVSSD